eukprot:PhF_6_TR13621/c0_g1_i2/m.21806
MYKILLLGGGDMKVSDLRTSFLDTFQPGGGTSGGGGEASTTMVEYRSRPWTDITKVKEDDKQQHVTEVQVWCAGAHADRFRSVLQTLYRDVSAVMIVFHGTAADNIQQIPKIAEDIRKYSSDPYSVVVLLLGLVDRTDVGHIEHSSLQAAAADVGAAATFIIDPKDKVEVDRVITRAVQEGVRKHNQNNDKKEASDIAVVPLARKSTESNDQQQHLTVPATPSVRALTDAAVEDRLHINHADILGKGGFSHVVSCTHNGDKCALKITKRASLDTAKKVEMITHEREIMRRLNHPNIIRLRESVETNNNIYMVLDYMKTDLVEFRKRNARSLREMDVAVIMRGLMSAVAYLHTRNIVHRDIKPENILINTMEDIRLADFGLAKIVQNDFVSNTPCGTAYCMAPEIIKAVQQNGVVPMVTTKASIKSMDIWSCGVVLYFLISGQPPFRGTVSTKKDRTALLSRMDRGLLFPDEVWDSVSEAAKDLVQQMLTVHQTKRLTAQQCLRHPFLRGGGEGEEVVIPSSSSSEVSSREELAAHVNELMAMNVEVAEGPTEDHVEPDLRRVSQGEDSTTKKPIVMNTDLMQRRKAKASQQQQQQTTTTTSGGGGPLCPHGIADVMTCESCCKMTDPVVASLSRLSKSIQEQLRLSGVVPAVAFTKHREELLRIQEDLSKSLIGVQALLATQQTPPPPSSTSLVHIELMLELVKSVVKPQTKCHLELLRSL